MSDMLTGEMDIEEIKKHIPHREPFLFVDKVLRCDLNQKMIVAQRTLKKEESFFGGHFPGAPIMPGVLIVEALAQVGAIYISIKGRVGLKVLMGIQNFKFRNPIYPGDTMLMKMEEIHISSFAGRCRGEVFVGNRKCVEGIMAFSMFKEKEGEVT